MSAEIDARVAAARGTAVPGASRKTAAGAGAGAPGGAAPEKRGAGPAARAASDEARLLSWATVSVLWRRDLARFFRQKSRVVGALAQPLLFWLVIGSGMAGSFRAPGAEGVGYMSYFFPGVIVMMVLFTSIFSTMSVIEDRREGFLQAVLVAPAGRWAVAAGKIAGGASVALLQSMLFLALAPAAGFPWNQIAWHVLVPTLVLLAVALTSLGFALAWWIDSTQGYHAVMSVVLIPMWVLSGAMFPAAGAHLVMAQLMRLNPLTYGVDGVRMALHGLLHPRSVAAATQPVALDLGLTAAFALAAFVAAVLAAQGWPRTRKEAKRT